MTPSFYGSDLAGCLSCTHGLPAVKNSSTSLTAVRRPCGQVVIMPGRDCHPSCPRPTTLPTAGCPARKRPRPSGGPPVANGEARDKAAEIFTHTPAHVWSHAAAWCGIEELLVLGQCSRRWREVVEANLLPKAVRRDCGASVFELKGSTFPNVSWSNFSRSLFSLALPTTGGRGARRTSRVACHQLLQAATETLAEDGQALTQILQHDACGNLTILSPLRVPVQSIECHALYWEVLIGSNANGNVLVGVMSDYGGIRHPTTQSNPPSNHTSAAAAPSSALCSPRHPTSHALLALRSLCICTDHTTCLTPSPPPKSEARRVALGPKGILGRPLTFAVCANTGEVYVEGRQITTTSRGKMDTQHRLRQPAEGGGMGGEKSSQQEGAGGTANTRTPVAVGVLMYREGDRCRFAFTLQHKDSDSPAVEMVLPHLYTPLAWDETMSFGVEMCVQPNDQEDWVQVVGPRVPELLPCHFTCQLTELNPSFLFS